MLSKKNISVFIVLSYLILTYSTPLIFTGKNYLFLTDEDGLFETAGALMYLLASLLFVYLYFKSKSGNDFIFFRTKRNLFYLLLGLLFFICFGEEISWGQRIFNIDTPEVIAAINGQNEINVHNLFFFDRFGKQGIEIWWSASRLLAIFWFLYCVLIPILHNNFKKISNFFTTLNLPIVPIWIGSLFVLNYIFLKFVEKNLNHLYLIDIALFQEANIEIGEANTGFLFFIVALTFYFNFAKESQS